MTAVPRFLYKYQPFDEYSLSNLRKRCIWFSKPESLNDPLDCAFMPNFEPTFESLQKLFIEKRPLDFPSSAVYDARFRDQNGGYNQLFHAEVMRATTGALKDTLDYILTNKGIACFSERQDNFLLWSHYSNGA